MSECVGECARIEALPPRRLRSLQNRRRSCSPLVSSRLIFEAFKND